MQLSVASSRLPQECRIATSEEWALLTQLEEHIDASEERIRQRIASLGWVRLLKTLPGVGTILGSTIYLEIGDVSYQQHGGSGLTEFQCRGSADPRRGAGDQDRLTGDRVLERRGQDAAAHGNPPTKGLEGADALGSQIKRIRGRHGRTVSP